jgi:hypothetical protein
LCCCWRDAEGKASAPSAAPPASAAAASSSEDLDPEEVAAAQALSDDDSVYRMLHDAIGASDQWNPAAREVRERPLWMIYEDQDRLRKAHIDGAAQDRVPIEVGAWGIACVACGWCVGACMGRVGGVWSVGVWLFGV